MRELVFEVTEEEEGGYSAEAVGVRIFTQGDTWQELEAMVLDATKLYYENRSEAPQSVRLHLLREAVLRVA